MTGSFVLSVHSTLSLSHMLARLAAVRAMQGDSQAVAETPSGGARAPSG